VTEFADALTSSMMVLVENVLRRNVCYRADVCAEMEASARFSNRKQCTSLQLDRRQAGGHLRGLRPSVWLQPSTRPSRSSINVIALVPFWTGLIIARLNSAYSRDRKDSRSNSLGKHFR
jgi:hypothetical protein